MKVNLAQIGMLILIGSTVCSAQWSTQQPVDTRAEPIYPNKPYSFRSTPPNYNPYQFNWATGQWVYVPIPYAPQATGSAYNPYRFNAYTGKWDYVPLPSAPGVGPVNNSGLSVPPPPPMPQPVQTMQPPGGPPVETYKPPTGQPTTLPSVQIAKPIVMTFDGKIVGEQAVDLYGDGRPHLLLRLRRADGASGTVDVGERFDMPEDKSPAANNPATITVTGNLGEIDGNPVIFANQIWIGEKTVPVVRGATTQAVK
jgi:hypothetical protein